MGSTIGLASDHAGFELKEFVKAYLEEKGFKYKDFGTSNEESCDYSDFAHKLGKAIEDGELEKGIGICGSGNGIAMTLNKYQHVRAALCWNPEIARLASAHNNANILVMPARFVTHDEAARIMDAYFSTPFEGGRHERRIEKIPIKQ